MLARDLNFYHEMLFFYFFDIFWQYKLIIFEE